jgi:hypothetical protein
MAMDGFWSTIGLQLTRLETARSADEVIAILGGSAGASAGDAFFAGSGGDGRVEDSLITAGWSYEWREASYHWAMRSPTGDGVTYVEGDVYRGIDR